MGQAKPRGRANPLWHSARRCRSGDGPCQTQDQPGLAAEGQQRETNVRQKRGYEAKAGFKREAQLNLSRP